MQNPLRYVWTLLFLLLLALIAFLLSHATASQNTSAHATRPSTQSNATYVSITQSQSAFDRNDVNGAITIADDVLSRDPNNLAALLTKAAALAQKGSLEFKEEEYGMRAIALAQQVLAADPNNAEAWRQIGYANEIMQKYGDAHAAYAKAIALDEHDAAAFAGDAHAWDLQGDMEKAEAGYTQALSLDQNNATAKLGLARVYVYQSKLDDALALYSSVADTAGNARQQADAAYSAGQVAMMKGDFTTAESRFRQSTAQDPSYALGWVGLGSELFRKATAKDTSLTAEVRAKLASESLNAIQNAITLNPDQSLAHFQLATEMVALGRYDDATLILNGLLKKIIDADITLSSIAKSAMKERVQSALNSISNTQ